MKSRIISFFVAVSITVMVFAQSVVTVSAADADYFTETEIKISEEAAVAVSNFKPDLELTDRLLEDDLWKVMALLRNNHPELFCLSPSYKYAPNVGEDGRKYVSKIIFDYGMTVGEYGAALERVNEWVDKVASLADDSFTDFEYILFFHDYLCANYEYDTSISAHDVYSFIKSGKGVCQSYTYAFIMLMNKVGLESSWAYSNEMNHIWNLVKLDGEWYHMDITWDDPVGGVTGKADHSYFLLSDKKISSLENKHFGWVAPYRCASETYDADQIRIASSAYAYLDDAWYYIKDGDLYVTDDPLAGGTLYRELDFVWNVWESTSYYIGSYSGLIAREGRLYMNTHVNILSFDTKNKTFSNLYTYRGGDGYLYGFRWDLGEDGVTGADLSEDSVVAAIGTVPNKVLKTEKIDFGTNLLAGDVDNNGKVNISDASAMLKYIAKWDVFVNVNTADYDANGKVNLSDVSLVLKKIAGWK